MSLSLALAAAKAPVAEDASTGLPTARLEPTAPLPLRVTPVEAAEVLPAASLATTW